MTFTEHTMSRDLYRHFAGQNWAPLVHIAAPMRYQPEADRAAAKSARIIDMLMFRKARKAGIGPFDLLAVEIKVTRADFLGDVRDPAKQAAWRTIAHRHTYAAPKDLIRPEEVPAGSGLIEVGPDRPSWPTPDVAWKVRAPYSSAPDFPSSLVMTFAYRAAQAEAKVRGFSFDTRDDQDPEAMRAELVRLRTELERLGRRLDRAVDDRDAWKTAFAATGTGVPCDGCGQPIRPKSIRSGRYGGWRHLDSANDEPCRKVRLEAAERAAEARWEALSDDDRKWEMRYIAADELEPWRHRLYFDDVLHPADSEAADQLAHHRGDQPS